MKVYEAVAQAFVDEGTTTVFGLLGDGNQHWVNALIERDTRFVSVRHEGPALAMAEGWASIHGAPGVCTTTNGPGVTQLATSMVVASRSRTPLVAFCGDTKLGDQAANHSFDEARFAAAVECGFVQMTCPDNAYDAVQSAFYLARTESRPVMLSAPANVQQAVMDDLGPYRNSKSTIADRRAYPSPSDIEHASDIVSESRRPVIIVGRGAVRSGAADAVVALADRSGAVVATTLMALCWPRDVGVYHVGISGLYATKVAIELFQDADCVIAVGASLNHYTTEHGYLYPNAKFIQFDIRPHLRMGDGRLADCYVQGDARLALELLNAALEHRGTRHTGYRTPEVKARLKRQDYDPTTWTLEPGTLDPRDACRALDEVLPDDVGIYIGHGHSCAFPLMACRRAREYAPAKPYILHNRAFGSIGQTISHAIGTVCATRKPLVVIDGDASVMMHLTEFDTAVRHHLPLLVLVLNDQAVGSELHKAFVTPGLDPQVARVPTPDLGAVGAALGGRGRLVRTVEQFRTAVAEFVRNPGPMLVDVRVSSTVESIPTRRLHGHENV